MRRIHIRTNLAIEKKIIELPHKRPKEKEKEFQMRQFY